MPQVQLIQETDSFINEILEKLEPTLKQLTETLKPKEPEELLTRKETAQLLKINLSTLNRWSKKGKIKRYCIENKIYYKRSEIEASLTQV
ncbi:helix-turn-helix domain-containing protein [Christiangramia forsetii]|uniref:Helix-turn-helix domain-containing protein n=2 Tax=Christiangramia forsetii TaxID=411153 RepID=A0LY03_CHRFK|nr:helix-turn-helix domain-containing protein [Christiangramia forsetii]GGG35346.1 DNA-binding protein [Christiangramia forsetii]CAL65248.1 hypothetical protein GFO_0262 [Christiangramia forsetii KT0803]